MSAPLTPTMLTIPLETHEARVAALILCGMLGNDNKAVVMARGVSHDFENFTGLYIEDYELDELADDPSWLDDYEDIQIFVTLPEGGAQ